MKASPPLIGIRILDFSRILAGPFCTQFLADMGAEVIKIERPGAGDDTRQWGPPWAGGESAYYLSCNRNKKSVTIDLQKPEGRELAKKLIGKSDVLVENFKVGTMAKWGLDFATLHELFPNLVYCSISAYGQDSSERHEPGYDFIIQARGGIMSITGPEDGEPHKVGVAIADITAGLYAASSILAALHHREKTGEGQHIDLSLLDSQVSWLANVGVNYLVSREIPKRFGNAHPNIVPYEVFPTADSYIAIAAANDAQFRRLCQALESPELAVMPEYATNPDRVKNRKTLIAELRKRLVEKESAAWIAKLREHKVSATPIQNIDEVFNDQVVKERGMVVEVPHPTAGSVNLIGAVPKFSSSTTVPAVAPPLLGEHTDEVLTALAGLSQAEIMQLRDKKVI